MHLSGFFYHLFVFYFGLMADVTPPVGLASFAAAAIARTDPIKTGVTAFFYSMRTAILPFLFIFNTQLLMIGIDSWLHLLLVVTSAIAANLLFAAATQGWFLARNRIHPPVTCDGQVNMTARPGDSVLVCKKQHALTLLHPMGHSFYSSCRDKLRWGDALVN